MRKVKEMRILFMAICMILAAGITAFASGTDSSAVPDYTRKGSLTVDVISTATGKAVPGGTLTLYKVAYAKQSDGGNVLELTTAFKDSGADLSGVSESDAGMKELAAGLKTYVNNKRLAGKTAAVDQKGRARWSDLELGLYLVVHTMPAPGYESMDAFLVSVPRYLDGAYVYDVEAAPKAGTVKTSGQKTPSGQGTLGGGGKLPQTGQIWWPVPLLAFMGILLVMIGWYRRRRCGKREW